MSFEDDDGYMWFSTDRGVTRFNGYSFEHFSKKTDAGWNAVFRMQEDDQGRLWSIVLHKQLYYLEDGEFKAYEYNAILDTCVKKNHIYLSQMDTNGTLWFAYRNHPENVLCAIDSNGTLRKYISHSEVPISLESLLKGCKNQTCQLINPNADSSEINKDKRMLLRKIVKYNKPTDNDSIVHFRRFFLDHNRLYSYDYKNGKQLYVFPSAPSGTLMFDRNHNLWISVPSAGAYCFRNGDLGVTPKIYLPGESVTSVYEDKEGGFWFTTLYNGIFYLNNPHSEVYNTNTGLPNDHVTAVLRVDDKLYCGHAPGQLSEFIQQDESFVFNSMFEGFKHVYRLEKTQNNKVTVLSGRSSEDLPQHFVSLPNRCFYNRNDTIYMFSRRGHLKVVSPNNDTIKAIEVIPSGERSMSYSEQYGLLLGTNFGLYHLKDDAFNSLKGIHPAFGERIQRIRAFGSKWQIICTLGKGLIFWSDSTIFVLDKNHGLNSNLCNDMYIQNDSTIWVCSNLGINEVLFQPDQKKLKVKRSLTLENGLLSNEVRSLFVDSTDIWAVTSRGLNRLPLFSLKENHEAPPIHIYRSVLGESEIKNGAVVSHTQNTFQISYVGLSYKWPRQLKYRYRLIGSEDESWKTTEQINLIYSTLESGKYRFEVEAINPSGVNSSNPAFLEFTIKTPFWRTAWFLLAMTGLLILLLFIGNRQNIRRVKRRTSLLKELDEYKHKALRSQMNPHFIYNSLNTVQSFILKNDTDHSMSYLAKFSRLMRTTFKNSGSNLVSLNEDLTALQLYTDLEMMRYPNRMNIQYQIKVTDGNDILIPPLLIQPFVENAILHGVLPKGEPGNILISMIKDDGGLLIRIEDDGVGMDISTNIQERKKWNQVIITKNEEPDKKSESGISVTQSRIRLFNLQHNGKDTGVIFEKNDNGEGVRVSFYLAIIYK